MTLGRRGVQSATAGNFATSGVRKRRPRPACAPTWICRRSRHRCSIPQCRNDTRDLGADRLGRFAPEDRGALGPDAPRDVGEYPPFTARLSDAWTGDLGTEGDPPLRRGRRPAALLLVARRRGQQHDDFAGVDEHLVRKDDVLMDAEWGARKRRAVTSGAGNTSRKLPPLDQSTSRSPCRAASTIAAAVRPGDAGTSKPHCAPSSRAASAVMGPPPGNVVA